MMGRNPKFCAICGQPSNGLTYCGDACKMRAYRKRKKQKNEAEKKTIEFDHWLIQDKLVKAFGVSMDYDLGRFFNRHEKQAYIDLLELLDKVTFQGGYHATKTA